MKNKILVISKNVDAFVRRQPFGLQFTAFKKNKGSIFELIPEKIAIGSIVIIAHTSHRRLR